MDKRYRYTIPNTERKHYHLVVSEQTHNVVTYYADKWGVTLTEATHRLFKKIAEEKVRDEQNNSIH